MSPDDRFLNHPVFYEDNENEHLSRFLDFHIKPGMDVFVLTDQNTTQHCLPVFRQKLAADYPLKIIEIQPGEKHKTLETCNVVWETLTHNLADRHAVLINLGGGVVCDLGGFAASVFKRGIRFMHVPTSLMAMADASIGGKTGIDFMELKNIIGSFVQPLAVFIDTRFLETLPERELNNGYAEMLKHGLIAEFSYFEELASGGPGSVTAEQIRISVEIKSDIVQRDPLEKGLRKALNFGHTIGHALESGSLQNKNNHLLHGEAVILGMMAETLLSERLGLIEEQLTERILSGLIDFSVFYNFDQACIDNILNLLKHDKKSYGGVAGFSLLKGPGQVTTGIVCKPEDIIDVLQELNEILTDN